MMAQGKWILKAGAIVAACGCVAGLPGCAGAWPWSDSGSGLATSAPPQPPWQAHSQAVAMAEAAEGTSPGPFQFVKNMGSAALEAVAPEPKVVAAHDPVRLASTPRHVDSSLHYRAARVYEAQQNTTRAIAHYELALQADPDDTRAVLGLARLYDRQSDFARAEELYQHAATKMPEQATVHNDLGLCFARQGKLDAAATALGRAVQLDPQELRYRNNLAAVQIDLGLIAEAYQTLAAVSAPAVAHYNTAFLLSRKNQQPPALYHLDMAMRADPSFQPARQLWQRLQPAAARQAEHSDGAVPRRLPPV